MRGCTRRIFTIYIHYILFIPLYYYGWVLPI
jgi:hypothetical protein